MLVYCLLYAVGIFALLASFLDKKNRKGHFFLLSSALLFVAMFRYEVGVDYMSYQHFISIIASGQNTYMEAGFEYLVKILHSIGGTDQLVFAVMSLFTLGFFFKFIKRHSSNPNLSLFLYLTLPPFYLAAFNGIRQFLAVAIFAYSIRFILNRSFFKYLIMMLVASTFHVTAILLIPFYFMMTRELKAHHILLGVVFYISFLQILGVILPLLGIFKGYLAIAKSESVSFQAYILLISSVILYFLRKRITEQNSEDMVFINLLLIGSLLAFTPLFTDLPVGEVTRMTSYFTLSLIIMIPECLRLFKKNQTKIIYLLSVIFICSFYFFANLFFKGELYKLIPYHININLF
jgi:hypothetical protein